MRKGMVALFVIIILLVISAGLSRIFWQNKSSEEDLVLKETIGLWGFNEESFIFSPNEQCPFEDGTCDFYYSEYYSISGPDPAPTSRV